MNVLKKLVSMFVACACLGSSNVSYAAIANTEGTAGDIVNTQETAVQEGIKFKEEWETERLRLTLSEKEDLPELGKMFSSYSVSKYMMTVPLQFYSENQAEDFLEQMILIPYTLSYTIRKKDDGAIIGQIAYIIVDLNCLELTYWLGDAYQGKGYASEAIINLSDYIFSNSDNLGSLKIEFMQENIASKKLAVKIISFLLEKHSEYKIESIPDKSKNSEVVDCLKDYVIIKCEDLDSGNEFFYPYLNKMFPKEYMKKGARFNSCECCLLLTKE